MPPVLILFLVLVLIIVFGTFFFWVQRYKRCPSDKVLVIYGKTGGRRASLCIHGGAAFVWPVIQDFAWLDLSPIEVDLGEKGFFSEDNVGVGVTSRLITGISTQSGVMENAAERLLGWDRNSIHELAHELSLGCMRSTIRSMKAASIKSAPNHLIDDLGKKVEEALNKVGLKVIGLDVEKIEVDLGSSSPSSPEGVAEGELVSPSKPHEDPVSEEATGFPEHSPSSSHHLT